MNEFKFELEELVRHVAARDYSDKMVVVARMFEETITGVEEKYVVSSFTMGQPIRHQLMVTELTKIEG